MGFICDSFILLGYLAFAHWNMEEEEFIQGNADDIDVVWFGARWR